MSKLRQFFSRNSRIFFWILFLFFYAAGISYAVPPTTYYQAGETLDPGCVPGSTKCTVLLIPDQTSNSGKFLTTNGSEVSWATGASGVTSVSGTTNRITSTGGTTPVIDISASYVGQSSITTLGTITTGVWNGTAITAARGGTGLTSLTAYALLAGGTTSTGNFQQVSGVGTSGQVLKSNGAGLLPSWNTDSTVYNSDGSLASDRFVLLGGHSFQIDNSQSLVLSLDPTTNRSTIQAYDGTNQTLLNLISDTSGGTVGFLLSTNSVSIFGDGTNAHLTLSGVPFLASLAGGGNGVVAIDNNGQLSLNSNVPLIGQTSANTSGTAFLGFNAGNNASTNGTVFIGPLAGQNATGAGTSVFVGEWAGAGGTNAAGSVFIGPFAGNGASSAAFSEFIGDSAGFGATGAQVSQFFGQAAGYLASGATGSNFIGNHAGDGATHAAASIFIGTDAGRSAVDARNSIFIGNNAGENDTVNVICCSSSSILIGNDTSTGDFTDSIALGSNATNTNNNQLYISDSITNFTIAGVNYFFPGSQGNNGQVLTNDGSGNLYWANVIDCPEEMTNGDFNGDASGWETAGGALPSDDWAYDSNDILHTSGTADAVFQSGTLSEGDLYNVSFEVGGTVGTITAALDGGDSFVFNAADGNVSFSGVWNNSAGVKIIFTPSSDFDGTISNVSVIASSCTTNTNIYNSNGTLTGNRTLNLGGNSLSFSDGSSDYVSVNGVVGSESVAISSFDGTGQADMNLFTNSGDGYGFLLDAFDGANNVSIFGDATAETISLDAAGGTTITGDLTVVGSGTTCVIGDGVGATLCSSDERLKKDIEPLADSLEQIMQLRPVTFTWKDPNKAQDTKIGFIAQEVQQVFPQFVGEVGNTGTLGIDYAALITPTIKAVQELGLRINDIDNIPGTDEGASFIDKLIAWFANAGNHITRIFTGEICLTDPDGTTECLDKTELGQLKNLLQANAGSAHDSAPIPSPEDVPSGDTPENDSPSDTPPVSDTLNNIPPENTASEMIEPEVNTPSDVSTDTSSSTDSSSSDATEN